LHYIKKILDTLSLIINELINKTKYFINKIHNKILFFKKKQKIIRNTYDPILKEKLNTKDELFSKLNELRKIDNSINKELSELQNENNNFQKKIEILSDLIISNRS
jgi:septal ring factor EnvC (AmiA/AmiB activator)